MKASRIWIVALPLAVLAVCLFLFCDRSPATDSAAENSIDHSAEVAKKPGTPETRVQTRASVAAPSRVASPADPAAPTLLPASNARLHIVDDASGAELDHITLCRGDLFERMGTILPAKEQLSVCVGTDLASPFALQVDEQQAKNGAATYFACNKEHAWGQISIELASRGEFVLRLGPGGALSVTVVGAEEPRIAELTLWRMDVTPPEFLRDWSLGELEGPVPTLNLYGLPTGTYRVQVEDASSLQTEVPASRIISIRVGERTEVALSIGEVVRQPVELHVTVKLEPRWALEEFTLDVNDADAPGFMPRSASIRSSDMVHASADAYVCKPFTVDSGVFQFTIAEVRFDVQAMIGPDPVQQLTISVPEPGLVVVDVFYEDTGANVGDARLQWLGKKLDPLATNTAGSQFIAEKAPGRFEFRAPIGPIGLCASSLVNRNYAGKMQSVDVVSGTNLVAIKLSRDRMVLVTLVEHGRRMPWPRGWRDAVSFESVGSSQVFPPGDFDAGLGMYTFHVSGPGSYRLSLRKLPGYRQFSFGSDLYDTPTNNWSIPVPLERD